MTIRELADRLGGRLVGGNAEAQISGVAAIADAEEAHVTFLGNPKYAVQLESCRAGAALVGEEYGGNFAGARIVVPDPSLSFVEVVKLFMPPPARFAPGIHPSAVVADDAVIGEGVSIQPNAVISAGVTIGGGTVIGANSWLGEKVSVGKNCHLHAQVCIREYCQIGDRVILHSGVVIGSDGFGFNFTGGRHEKIPQVGIVQIDDDVEIGANSAIDRARFGRTWIQKGTKIDNLVQVAHNVVVGEHCLLVAQVGVAGSVTLGNFVTLAGQVGVAGHLKIGDGAIIGAQAGIGKDIEPGTVHWGSPSTTMRKRKEIVVYQKRLGEIFKRVKKIEDAQDKSES